MTEQDQITPSILGRLRAILDLLSDPRLTECAVAFAGHRTDPVSVQLDGDTAQKARGLATAAELLDEPVVSVASYTDHAEVTVTGAFHGVTVAVAVVLRGDVLDVARSVPEADVVAALAAVSPAEAELAPAGAVA